MTKKTLPKIVLTRVQDIPLDKLVLAQSNVRRVQNGLSIEELAEDIARRGLLQNLCVRPQLDDDGEPTGRFDVPAGGRRFRALQLLVKQKRMARNAPVPCSIRTDGFAEEDSLAENVQRIPLHPLDQYRAFATLQERGLSDEDIAARFFVPVQVVRQRLKLAAASPVLLDAYLADELTLAQLEAFCVTADTARQEDVWKALKHSWKEPYQIRRLLTERAVRADDRRALYVGLEAYEAAGGLIERDLFQKDGGGYLQDEALLDRLVGEKLDQDAAAVRAEGWGWVTSTVEHPYDAARGMRHLDSLQPPLTDAEAAEEAALTAEAERLEAEYEGADDTDGIDTRLEQIADALRALEERPSIFAAEDMARAGAFVSLDERGRLSIRRGFVRAYDDDAAEGENVAHSIERVPEGSVSVASPLPNRLLTSLTAWRSMALREALGRDVDVALTALLQRLCLALFGGDRRGSCLEIDLRSRTYSQAAGLSGSDAARGVEARHDTWARQLPSDAGEMWRYLAALDRDSQLRLLAHCSAMSIDAVHEDWPNRRGGHPHALTLAEAVAFDPVKAGWRPTEESYLGHVTKAQILAAVREGVGEAASQLIDHLKKPEMAREAERLLADSSWLPEPLRLAEGSAVAADAEADALPAFLEADDEAAGEEESHLIAAE